MIDTSKYVEQRSIVQRAQRSPAFQTRMGHPSMFAGGHRWLKSPRLISALDDGPGHRQAGDLRDWSGLEKRRPRLCSRVRAAQGTDRSSRRAELRGTQGKLTCFYQAVLVLV